MLRALVPDGITGRHLDIEFPDATSEARTGAADRFEDRFR